MPKLESCCHEVMEGWNDIPFQETPLGISKLDRSWNTVVQQDRLLPLRDLE